MSEKVDKHMTILCLAYLNEGPQILPILGQKCIPVGEEPLMRVFFRLVNVWIFKSLLSEKFYDTDYMVEKTYH